MNNMYEDILLALNIELELKNLKEGCLFYKRLEERNYLLNKVALILDLPFLKEDQRDASYIYSKVKCAMKNGVFNYKYYLNLLREKDIITYKHSINVGKMMEKLAISLGLREEICRLYLIAGYLHDIGKLNISNEILNKPGKLDEDERKVMETHPSLGMDLIDENTSSIIKNAIYGHHLSFNGKNSYPYSIISGTQIPLETRICTVCDIFDALTAERTYKKGMSSEKALQLMDTMENIDPFCLSLLKETLHKEVAA